MVSSLICSGRAGYPDVDVLQEGLGIDLQPGTAEGDPPSGATALAPPESPDYHVRALEGEEPYAERSQGFRVDEEAQKLLKVEGGVLGTVPRRVEGRSPRTGRLLALGLAIVPRVTLDELGTHAGSITYGALFSIPPLLMLALASVDTFAGRGATAQQWVYEHAVDLVPGLESLLDLSAPTASARLTFGIIGAVTLVWAATGLASRVRHALGIVHRTSVTGLTVGHAAGLMAQVPVGFGLLGLLAVASGLAVLAQRDVIGPLLHTAGYAVIAVLGVLFWTATYWLLIPRRRIVFRGLLVGGALFALCFALIERLGTLYVTYVSSKYLDLYGTIGNVLAILALLYIMAWAFLLCAEINQVLHEQRQPPGERAGR